MKYFDELEDQSYYNKIMYTFEKIHILGLLQRVDMATMAASVEARYPLSIIDWLNLLLLFL